MKTNVVVLVLPTGALASSSDENKNVSVTLVFRLLFFWELAGLATVDFLPVELVGCVKMRRSPKGHACTG